jgi:hypothetical protein
MPGRPVASIISGSDRSSANDDRVYSPIRRGHRSSRRTPKRRWKLYRAKVLLADLGVTKSHSRPHCSNDNPYSESQFKTLKQRPEFPDRFGCLEDAHAFCTRFFRWYNHDHRHSGIGFHTPADVHFGRAELVRAQRAKALNAAYDCPGGRPSGGWQPTARTRSDPAPALTQGVQDLPGRTCRGGQVAGGGVPPSAADRPELGATWPAGRATGWSGARPR